MNSEYMSVNENQVKHLEMIETIIERMGQNSFALRGWAITLIVAISALSAAGSNRDFFWISAIPVLVFWGLDSFYLMQERKFRILYNKAIDGKVQPFSMDLSGIKDKETHYIKCFFSITERLFYGACIIGMVVTFIWIL